MTLEAKRKALVAVDLGAQSCRVSLLRWPQDLPEIEIVHRFANSPLTRNDSLRWDVAALFEGVLHGLRLCAQRAPEGVASIAVDGWAVDYVRLQADGTPAALPFCYRDPRTERAEREVHAILPSEKLYALTGIQILRINSLYQLYADKLAGEDIHLPWLNLPEYITYRLCGKRVAEFTNATHTGLVRLGTHSWCQEIFETLALDLHAAPQIVPCGSLLGPLTGEISGTPEFHNTQVIAAACHDTAAAIAGIPAHGDDWAFISSGTWSMVGTLLDAPCVTLEAQTNNFTNLGCAGGKFCFLKNVNGMWLLRQCTDDWEQHGLRWPLQELLSSCTSLPVPAALIDIDDPQLMLPGNAINKINTQLARLGQPAFAFENHQIPQIANLIFHSMAARYAEVLNSIRRIAGKQLKRLFIVGGGSQNTLLNRFTADLTGLEVVLGSVESTTIGNFAIQLATLDNHSVPAQGASADAIAEWAKRLAACAVKQSNDRETN